MKKKDIGTSILLTLVTCGIYGIYWFITVNDDVVTLNGGKNYNTSGGVAFLLTLVTCGIYGIYWAYQMGKALNETGKDKGIEIADNSILYLVLNILGLGIVNYCLIQSDVNKLIDATK